MIKIVIVDDEVLVRQGIKSYIQNSGEDMEVAGIFSNAKDAAHFLGHTSVQILITDIKMAQMDGLELIQHCVNCLYPMGIIVLSCYDNFEYARNAFAFGADAYLLKHEVSQDELISVIKKTYIHLQKRVNPPYPRKALFYSPTSDEAECDSDYFAVVKICFRAKYEQFVRLRTNADSKMIFNLITEITAANSIGKVIRQGEDIFLRMTLGECGSREDLRERAKLAQKHLCTNIMNYFNERVYLAVSDLHIGLDDLQSGIEQANKATLTAFYDIEGTLFFFSDCNCSLKDYYNNFYTETIDLLSCDWRVGMDSNLDRYIERSKQNALPPSKLKRNMQGFIYKLEDYLFKYYNTSIDDVLPQNATPNLLDDLDTYTVVKDYVLFVIDKAMEYVANMRDGDALLSRVIAYIDRNYATGITLSMLSEMFHINQSYLCKLFRNNMQTCFVSYLNQVRIDHAKKLMANSGLSMDEIAEKTGFSNANYLVRVFKKITGITVGEYRKKLKF